MQLQAFPLGMWPDRLQSLPAQLGCIAGLRMRLESAARKARKIQCAIQQAAQGLAGAAGSGEQVTLALGQCRLPQQLDRGQHGLRRVAHLVADHADGMRAASVTARPQVAHCEPQQRQGNQQWGQQQPPARGRRLHPVQCIPGRGRQGLACP